MKCYTDGNVVGVTIQLRKVGMAMFMDGCGCGARDAQPQVVDTVTEKRYVHTWILNHPRLHQPTISTIGEATVTSTIGIEPSATLKGVRVAWMDGSCVSCHLVRYHTHGKRATPPAERRLPSARTSSGLPFATDAGRMDRMDNEGRGTYVQNR